MFLSVIAMTKAQSRAVPTNSLYQAPPQPMSGMLTWPESETCDQPRVVRVWDCTYGIGGENRRRRLRFARIDLLDRSAVVAAGEVSLPCS